MTRGCETCGQIIEDPAVLNCPYCEHHPPLINLDGEEPAPPANEPAAAVDALPAAAMDQDRNEDAAQHQDHPPPPPPRPLQPPPEAGRPQPQPATAPGDIGAVLEELRALNKAKPRPLVIGLIGFSTTGKTWFLERLKLELDHSHTIRPNWWDRVSERGSKIQGTRGVSLHRFVFQQPHKRGASAGGFSFYVLDIEGELYREAVRGHFSNSESADLLETIILCSGYLFILPAAEYLFDDELHERGALIPGLPSEEVLQRAFEMNNIRDPGAIARARREMSERRHIQMKVLHNSVTELATLIAYVEKAGDAQTALRQGLSDQKLLDFMEKRGGLCAKPAALVLTMADNMEPVIAASSKVDGRLRAGGGTSYDQDPLVTTMYFKPKILDRLARSFRWWKVEFATAWEGHRGGDEPDTKSAQFGLLEIIEWFWTARRDARPAWWKRRVGTSAAIRLRALLEPGFGRAWRENVER